MMRMSSNKGRRLTVRPVSWSEAVSVMVAGLAAAMAVVSADAAVLAAVGDNLHFRDGGWMA
jgi:hypothetical protein